MHNAMLGKSIHRGLKPYFSMFSSLMTTAGLEESAVQLPGCYQASYFHSHSANGQGLRQVIHRKASSNLSFCKPCREVYVFLQTCILHNFQYHF